MGVVFLSLWGTMGDASNSLGDVFGLGQVLCGKKKKKKVWRVDPYVFFGRFERQVTKLYLKMMCCPSKDLRVLLFSFTGWR